MLSVGLPENNSGTGWFPLRITIAAATDGPAIPGEHDLVYKSSYSRGKGAQ
jgi:hypothetical protein